MSRAELARTRDLVQRDRRRHRRVERLRDDRDPRAALARGDHVARQPVALGADEQRQRRAGATLACSAVGDRAQRLGRVGAQRDPLARQLGDVVHARDRDGEDRAHARAHGLRRVHVGAARAERDARGAERVRRAQDRADVARVADAVQVDAQRPGRRAPGLLVDGDHARARAERRGALQRRRVDVVEARLAEPRACQAVALDGVAAGRARGGDEVLALDREAPAARALAPRREALEVLQSLVVARGYVCHRELVVWSWHKKSAVLVRNDAREAVEPMSVARVRQPTPRGRSRQNVGTCRRRGRRCRRAPCGRARRRRARGRA